jgi:hypothetical protein
MIYLCNLLHLKDKTSKGGVSCSKGVGSRILNLSIVGRERNAFEPDALPCLGLPEFIDFHLLKRTGTCCKKEKGVKCCLYQKKKKKNKNRNGTR